MNAQYDSPSFVSPMLYAKIRRALPLLGMRPLRQRPSRLKPLTTISLPAITAHPKAIFYPLQRIENQCSQKAKIMFETRKTTSNVVFLRCLVSIRACGKFFGVWENSFFDKWKNARFSDHEIKSAAQKCDNKYNYDSY